MKHLSDIRPSDLALAQTSHTLANAFAAYPDVYASEVGAAPPLGEEALQYGQPERSLEDLYGLARNLGDRGVSPLVVGFTRRQFGESGGSELLVARPDTGTLVRPGFNHRGAMHFTMLTPQGQETTYNISAVGLREYFGDSVSGPKIEGEEEQRVLTALEDTVPHEQFMGHVRIAQDQQRVRLQRWAAKPIDLMFQRAR